MARALAPTPFVPAQSTIKGPHNFIVHASNLPWFIHPHIYPSNNLRSHPHGGHSIWRHAMWRQPCSHPPMRARTTSSSIHPSIHPRFHSYGPISFGGMQCGHSHAAIHFSSCMPLLVVGTPRGVRHGYPCMHVWDLDHDWWTWIGTTAHDSPSKEWGQILFELQRLNSKYMSRRKKKKN